MSSATFKSTRSRVHTTSMVPSDPPTASIELTVQHSQEGPMVLSDSDEDLINRPLDPGDDMYRGKSTSCVVTDPNIATSLPRTRRIRTRSLAVLSDDDQPPHSRKRPTVDDGNVSSKKPRQQSSQRPLFVDIEAAADESELSDLDDSEMDQDDVDFIDDSNQHSDPVGLYTSAPPPSLAPAPIVQPASHISTSTTPTLPQAFPVPSTKPHSPSSLGNPFSAGTNDDALDAIIQKALKNKDFLMRLLRSVADDGTPVLTPVANLAADYHSLVPPSPLTTMPTLSTYSPSLTATPPPAIAFPITPTKPRTKVKGKGKGKAKAAQPKVSKTFSSLLGSTPPLHDASTASSTPSHLVAQPSASSSSTPSPIPGFTLALRSLPTPVTPGSISAGTLLSAAVPVTPTATPRMSMRDLATLLPAGFDTGSDPNSAPGNTASLRLCPPLPKVCEVDDRTLHDPLLAETYAGLVNLKKGRFSSWSTNIGRGQVVFSMWITKSPNMNPNTAYSIMTMTQSRRFINPSRLSPLEVQLREIRQNNTLRYNIYRDDVPAIAMSCGYLWDSHLTEPKPYGLKQKMVSIVLHKQEWERLVAFCCMIFNIDVIAAQFAQSAMQFSTRADWAELPLPNDSSPAPTPSGSNDDRMFTHSPSAATQTSSSSRQVSEAMALSANSTIPVYDARDTDFNFQNDIENLHQLPLWEGELPRGSFVVVGYTLAAYFPNQKWNLATNVRWVVLVGLPEL